MKKSNLIIAILLVIAIIILILSLFIKSNEDKTIEKDRVDYTTNVEFTNDKQLIAIAYLNNIDEISSKYIFNLENIKVFQTNGNEKYLIIPRYNEMEINIYEASLNEDKLGKGKKVANTNLPFIINCNEDEKQSNIIIEIKYSDIIFEYSPSTDLKDNSLTIDEHILNITKGDS